MSLRSVGAALALAGAVWAGPAASAEVTLRLGHATFESHPFHDAAVRFRDAVAARSNGEIEIQIFPSRQLGGVKELTEGVQFGTVDMTVNSSSAYADLAPAVDALQLPWLIESYEHLAALAVTEEAQALTGKLADSGIVALGIFDGGQRHFLTIDKPIAALDDFAGLKTRVAPVRLHLEIWQAIGVNPTPMAYGEVYTALETGTLDATETNITSVYSEKYYEVAKEVTLTGHYFWPALMLINQARLESLTPEQQTILREAAKEVIEPQIMAIDALDRKLMGDLEAEGVSFHRSDAETIARMREATAPLYEQYMERDPAIAAFVEKARALAH